MPIVRSYPLGEVSPQPLPNVQPTVPAAGDPALFGASRARDLQVAGQALGQASDSLAALYERTAREANETRVQDLNNQFLDGRRGILQGFYGQSGADAIKGADAATDKLAALRDEIFEQAANPWQRQRLGRILDTHLADSKDGISRHVVAQQDVYGRDVATASLATARTQAIADPDLLPNALYRAESAARVLHSGQPPEAIEAGVRAARGSVVAGVIGDRLARNDPMGVDLFRRYGNHLDATDRRTLGGAAEMLSITLDADAWLRERGATLPTGDASMPSAEPSWPDQDGIVGTRRRLDEIEERSRALTALNDQEFATNPARLRANQRAIDTEIARSRAAVKADTDGLYADLRRHLTIGGPNDGPAVTLPPATIMSRLTGPQQDAVIAQVMGAIAGRKPTTDPQTWYAIRQSLTGDDAGERQRWAYTNLVLFMGRLSGEDYAELEKLQSTVRTDDGGAGQSRLQIVNLMANHALRSVGIDPTPRPDASPGSDAAKAARFHRTLRDDLSAIESRGRAPTASEAYALVNGLVGAAIKGGWIEPLDGPASPTLVQDIPSNDSASDQRDVVPAQAGPKGLTPRAATGLNIQQASLSNHRPETPEEKERRKLREMPIPEPGDMKEWRPDFFIPEYPFKPKPPPEAPAPAYDNMIALRRDNFRRPPK